MENKRVNNFRKETTAKNERRHLDVCLSVDSSLKGWTDSCLFRYKTNYSSEEKRNIIRPVYCEVLNNGNCNECRRTKQRLSSINSSLSNYPDLETGSYLLFLTVSEKQRKTTPSSNTSIMATPVLPDSGYTTQQSWRNSPVMSERSRSRVRAASAVASECNWFPSDNSEGSGYTSPVAWRPSTSKSVRFDTSSPSGQRVLTSRTSKSRTPNSIRRISPLSQEGWSVKQIEAWRLLAPTPPQIEVSQMNVSIFTPKELPGIKIFDESLFVI